MTRESSSKRNINYSTDHDTHDMWSYDDEPHAGRRKLIIAKYPEIKSLMRPDSRIIIQIVIMFAVQLIAAYIANFLNLKHFLLLAYVVGGTLNHSLSLGMHELSHYTAFGATNLLANHICSLICNMPLAVPAAFTFQKYHSDHHRYLGDEILDTDIPSALEIRLFSNRLGKFLFIVFQPLSYCFRPFCVNPKMISSMEIVNWCVQLLFDFLIFHFFGKWSLIYLLLGTIFGLSVHPISGHFISEHYVFIHGYETYSYYGPLNWITFNVGYHNEHHDFPCIPGYNLPKVRKIAHEFYDSLPSHSSWVRVLYDFIMIPSVNLRSRVKRKSILKKRL